MKELVNIFLIVLLSAAAGGTVSLPISFINQDNLLKGFLTGAAAGAVIGFAARWAFSGIYLRFRHRPLPAYLAMTGTVGTGTLLGCLVMDIELLPIGIIVIVCSMIIGIIMTAVIFRYSVQLNEKLQKKKKTIAQNNKAS